MATVIFGKTISEWILKPLVRWIGGVLGLLAIIWGFGAYKEGVGRQELMQESKQQGAKANAKNQDVRAASERPGAADRVRDKFCRDC